MEINLQPGKYVVAVSGGVDSVVLLDLLATFHLPSSTFQLVVAHFDHGIRQDSADDARFVKELAAHYGLEYVEKREELGATASEERARLRRYDFLYEVLREKQADAIVTAHHYDDWLETACLNIMRGSGYRGVVALRSRPQLVRPLLDLTKQQLVDYATERRLEWVQDSTNLETNYARNALRRQLAGISSKRTKELETVLKQVERLASHIEPLLENLLDSELQDSGGLLRQRFIALPYDISCEILAEWLRRRDVSFDRRFIELTVVALKTLAVGRHISLDAQHFLEISRDHIRMIDTLSV